MKGIFKILSIVVLLGALVGGAILVQRNQETRKGAAAITPELVFQMNNKTVSVGQNFNINLAIDTKSLKVDVFEFGLEFDKTKLRIDSISPIWYTEGGSNLYSEGVSYFKHLKGDDVDTPPDQVMLKNIDNTNGNLKVSAVSMRPVAKTASGVVQIFKMSVTILADGPATIKMTSAGTNQAQLDSKMVALKPGKSIIFNSSRPTSRPKLTPTRVKVTPTLSSPLRCGWCGTSCINSKIKRMCPMIVPPKGSSCVAENGACVIKISRVTPTGVGVMSATLNGGFNGSKVKVGDEVSAFMKIGVGNYKVSAVNVRAIFDPNYFDILSVTPITGAEVLRNNVNKVTGVVDLYLTWKGSASTLPSSPEFVIVKLKTKKSGVGTFKFDGNYKNEVSGVDSAGKSVGFTVLISGTVPRLIITDLTVAPKCLVCTSGLAKSMGNGNCDAVINSLDFEIWRSEVFDQGGVTGKLSSTWNADYSCDQKVSAPDFEIWRATVFK